MAEENKHLYESNPPIMQESLVCFADILGFSKLSQDTMKPKIEGGIERETGEDFLKRLHKALKTIYDAIKDLSTSQNDEKNFESKIFTDNMVIGYPINTYFKHQFAVADMLIILSFYQISLAAEGFLVRGGIAKGQHYMDEYTVFGDALIEAHDLENQRGGPPKITIGKDTIQFFKDVFLENDKKAHSLIEQYILQDSDGSSYVNYLQVALIDLDSGIDGGMFQLHEETITSGLEEHRNNPTIKPKYEWAARYHNWFCRDTAKRYDISFKSESEHKDAVCMYSQAQELLNYQIKMEEFAPSEPSRHPEFQAKP